MYPGPEEKEECGGTRFLKEAGFPRFPSGKNFYISGGEPKVNASTGVSIHSKHLDTRAICSRRYFSPLSG